MKPSMIAALGGMFLAGLISATTSIAGPFGLDMGLAHNKADLSGEYKAGQVLKLNSVPKPNSMFEHYFATFSDEEGLCSILVFSKDNRNDRYGTASKNTFDKLEEQIDSLYGSKYKEEQKSIDSDGIWQENRDFVMSINQNERYHTTFWSNDNKELRDGVTEVMLTISATSLDNSYVAIRYRFSNYEKCKNVSENELKDSL